MRDSSHRTLKPEGDLVPEKMIYLRTKFLDFGVNYS